MVSRSRTLTTLAVLAVALGCSPAPKPHGPGPTVPPITAERATRECTDLYVQELRRQPDPDGLASCVVALLHGRTGEEQRAALRAGDEWIALHTTPPTPVIHADGKVFRTADGTPWRWKGVSAFALLSRFAKGEDLRPFLEAYRGFNVLRVWAYVQGDAWAGHAWDVKDATTIRTFLARVARDGWIVELTLLTDDKADRLAWATALVPQLAAAPRPTNLVLEIGNEPRTHKAINTRALKAVLDASGFVYASGDYEESERAFGSYLVAHTARDAEWPRRAHDCLEYYTGGGPHKPTDPAHHVPCVLDEPGKPQDAKGHRDAAGKVDDFRAYFGAAGLMAAGATFHSETGKYAQLPTDEERRLAAAALEGLDAFPADAPLLSYRRPNDQSLRTYTLTKTKDGRKLAAYMVRVRPTSPAAPGAGWQRVGSSAVLWRR